MKPTLMTTCDASRRDCLITLCDEADHRLPIITIILSHSEVRVRVMCAAQHDHFGISRETISKNEARHAFWGEAALFGILAVTALLPLISNAHALMEFARAISNY